VQVLWYLTTKPLMQNESNRWDVSSVSSLVALSLRESNALSERDTAPSTNLDQLEKHCVGVWFYIAPLKGWCKASQ